MTKYFWGKKPKQTKTKQNTLMKGQVKQIYSFKKVRIRHGNITLNVHFLFQPQLMLFRHGVQQGNDQC